MRGSPHQIVDGKKICITCKQLLSLDLFYTYKKQGRTLVFCSCKTCHRTYTDNYKEKNKEYLLNKRRSRYHITRVEERARVKKRRQRNPERASALSRNSRFKHLYGITLEDYDRMFLEQGGKCAICGLPEKRLKSNGSPYNLSVDHNHTTKTVRQLLCYTCNSVIGYLNEDLNLAEATINYLRKWDGK